MRAVAILFVVLGVFAADESSPMSDIAVQKAALGEFNAVIGKWNGVGQPRRGSTQGAWQEKAEWVWDFADHGVAVRIDVKDGKLAKTIRLTFDPLTKEYQGVVTSADGPADTYRGKFEKDHRLILTTPESTGDVKRITITFLNEKRTLILFEQHPAGQVSFNRVAEVGYTRDGTRLATSNTSGPECIVTGGTGTMEVKYKGQTYYVCCTGCRQAFEDDPEGVIAEAAARRKREMDKGAK